MKKIYLLPLFLTLFLAPNAFGQYCTNPNMVWAFGFHGGVNFTTGTPVAFSSPLSTLEGCAAVSDLAGNPLFFTDGKNVYDRTGTIMPHGTSIVSYATVNDAAQGAQIVPIVGTSMYYIFSGDNYTIGHRAYTIVDMSLNGGLGDVMTAYEGIAMGIGFSENMTEVAGNNCDVWLIVHRRDSAVFWLYNITASGITGPVVSSVGTFANYHAGVIKVSPNRQKIVVQNCEGLNGSELYDFDPTTGIVSNCRVLNFFSGYGAEFSPDNTKLYTGGLYATSIYQYDISLPTTAAILASQTVVGTTSNGGDMRLAPNGKIYITKNGVGFLDCINSPNLAGPACGFAFNAVALAAATHGELGLPNMVYSVAPADTVLVHHDTMLCIPTGGLCTISAHDTNIGAASGGCVVPTYLWDDGITTTHSRVVSATGNYWVRIYNGCGMVVDTIHVHPQYIDTLSGIFVVCAGATTTLTATPAGGYWSSMSPSIATIGSSSGVLSGVSGGTAVISYNVSIGCPAAITATVVPAPSPIIGATTVCMGSTTPLFDGVPGGAWSSSNPSAATVDPITGLVTSVSPGATIISYLLGGL